MKFLKNLLTTLIILILLVLAGRRYLGGFSTPQVLEKNMGPYTIAYMTVTGEYSNVGPFMTKIADTLSGENIVMTEGIGIYYDNPDAVSGARLKSDIGGVVDSKDAAKLNKKSTIYKITTIPAAVRVVVEFPIKTTLSYMVGPIKAYPVMNTYMTGKGYKLETPRIELYDMTAKKIFYMANIITN